MFFTVCVHRVLVLMRRTIEIELNGFWKKKKIISSNFLWKSFSVQSSTIESLKCLKIYFVFAIYSK